MLKSSVCDCSDAFILISGARAVAGAGVKRWNKAPEIINKQDLKIVHLLPTAKLK